MTTMNKLMFHRGECHPLAALQRDHHGARRSLDINDLPLDISFSTLSILVTIRNTQDDAYSYSTREKYTSCFVGTNQRTTYYRPGVYFGSAAFKKNREMNRIPFLPPRRRELRTFAPRPPPNNKVLFQHELNSDVCAMLIRAAHLAPNA